MTTTHTGWLLFVAALGMMATLIAPEIAGLATFSEALTPSFIGKTLAHFGTVIAAFVAGKIIPTDK